MIIKRLIKKKKKKKIKKIKKKKKKTLNQRYEYIKI